LVVVLIELQFFEDFDKFADASARQRLAGVHQWLVIADPGLRVRQFLRARAGRNDFGDGYIVDFANRSDDVVAGETVHGIHPLAIATPPADNSRRAGSGTSAICA